MLADLKRELIKLKNNQKAKILSSFFKTGKGEYGEGDVFLGITVPQQRMIAKKYTKLKLKDLQILLNDKIHEFRLVSLLILIEKYRETDNNGKKKLAGFYLKNTKYINNWDLVDLSSDKILGDYLLHKNKKIIYKLANSKIFWERRIAVLSTFCFIKNYKYDEALKLYKLLLGDRSDLIHKAVGWMLREIGKRNLNRELEFLNKHHRKMPRTMLRYSIERLDREKKSYYLSKGQNRVK